VSGRLLLFEGALHQEVSKCERIYVVVDLDAS
jgi:hypothetical protein